MSGDSELIEQLRSTRPDYEAERVRHRFQMDAFGGTGGFRGSVKQPASGYWGAAAEIYGDAFISAIGASSEERAIDTYLDRFPREDMPKFKRRASLAHYVNDVEPVVSLPLSYLNRQSMIRAMPAGLEKWAELADGRSTWEQLVQDVIQERAAVLGYCPVLFDLPPSDGLSVAQAAQQGHQLQAIPLFPAHLLNWSTDRVGRFEWVKTRMIDEVVHPLGGSRSLEKITIWYPSWCEIWYIDIDDAGDDTLRSAQPELIPHTFGEVPIRVLQWKPIDGDYVRGLSMIESIAPTAKRIFNYQSELDEHIRQSVFAFLQVPIKDPEQVGPITTGEGNALPIDPDSRQSYQYITPSTEVSDIIQKCKEESRKDIYRMAKAEFTQASSGVVKSGVSRAYEFETANRSIADYARRVGRFEQSSLTLAGKGVAGGEGKVSVTAPTKFAVEEMLQALEEAGEAISLDLGPTATALIKTRVAKRMLPNLSDKDSKIIEDEIAEQEATAGREDRQREAADEAILATGRLPAA